MFLSKRSGVWHLFYSDETGKRHSKSTATSSKSEAVKFLRLFNTEEDKRRREIQHITLSDFAAAFLRYYKTVNTPNTVRTQPGALEQFKAWRGGDTILSKVTRDDCEWFLAVRSETVRPYTLRFYFLAPRAAFERAVTWAQVRKPF